jgi:hypothetical protein
MGNCNFIVLHLVQAPNQRSEDRNFGNDVAIEAVLQPPALMREICENQNPTQEKKHPVKENNHYRAEEKKM